MIRFSLKCPDGHVFESWFKSTEAFDTLRQSDMVTCPECGAAAHEKALMAPNVRAARNHNPDQPMSDVQANMHALAAPSSEAEAALRELRRKVQDNSEYVGERFAEEARAIHLGDAPERSIYGETSRDEARKLVEDGVPVAPLPFVPTRKTN
jgi:hypothetical protein